jgi:hypothetical protein
MKNNSIKIRRRNRKGSISFNPDRQFIAGAVEDFLRNGGKIEQLKPDESSFKHSMNRHDGSLDADEFLLGG